MEENRGYPLPEQIEEQYRYITYLIGSMEICVEKDDGTEKREIVEKELLLRNVYPINPVKLETSKTGLRTGEIKEKMSGWVASGNWELFKEKAKEIWKGKQYIDGKEELVHIPGDIDYVTMSNWLTFTYSKGDKPCIEENSQILMDDLTSKSIREIEIGDKIKGIIKINGVSKLITSIVMEKYYKGKKNTLLTKDSFDNQIITTPEHKFLSPNKKHGSKYESISDINEVFSLPFAYQNDLFLKGWLVGYLQHDGNFWESKVAHRVSALSDKEIEIDKIYNLLKYFKFNPKKRILKKNNNIYFEVATYSIRDYEILKEWKHLHDNIISFKQGWIAGAIDADGYYEKESIRYTQSIIHEEQIAIFEKYCNELDLHYSKNIRKLRDSFIKNRKVNSHREVCICLSKLYFAEIPSQLEYKRKKLTVTIDKMRNFVTSEKYYRLPVYDIVTTTGNFIANGFIVHNCGSFFECGIALEHNIPIYLITDLLKKELPKSLLQGVLVSGGEAFNSLKDYLEFIDKKYKLKRKEPKIEIKEEKKND